MMFAVRITPGKIVFRGSARRGPETSGQTHHAARCRLVLKKWQKSQTLRKGRSSNSGQRGKQQARPLDGESSRGSVPKVVMVLRDACPTLDAPPSLAVTLHGKVRLRSTFLSTA